MNIKVWKDAEGVALEFEDAKFELSHVAFEQLLNNLTALEAESLDGTESILHEIELDLPEQE